jgi:acylpyruvate hydrolase
MSVLRIRLVRFQEGDSVRLGGIVDDKVYDLNYSRARMLADKEKTKDCYEMANREIPSDMIEFIKGGQSTLDLARQTIEYLGGKGISEGPSGESLVRDLNKTVLLTPIERPSIWCMALIYQGHADAGGLKIPEEPFFFHKPLSCLVGPDETVVIPKGYPDMIVYGTELTLVFGRAGKHVSEESAYDYVYGYTIFNDVTARGIPLPQNKIIDTFAPVGPWIVPKDEIPDPQSLGLKFRLNGEEKQNLNTSEMIFKIPMHVRILSTYCKIEPGDILCTGDVGTLTPLKAGDVMEAEIEDIGVLRNPTRLEE